MTIHMRQRQAWHPTWCAKDDTCTATGRHGTHRSRPIEWENPTIRITATRVRAGTYGVNRLELVTVVCLDDNPQRARQQSRHLIAHTWLGAVAGLRPTAHRPHGREASNEGHY